MLGIIESTIAMRKKARSSHGCPATVQRSDISMAAPRSKRQCIRHRNPSEVVLALEAPPINTHHKSLLREKIHDRRCQNGDMVSDHRSKTTDFDKKPCQISDQDGQTESANLIQSQKLANCSIRLNFKNKCFQIVYHDKQQIPKPSGPPPMSPLKQSTGIHTVGAPLPPHHPCMRLNISKAAPHSKRQRSDISKRQRSDISKAAPHSKRQRSDISMAAPHSKRQCIRHRNPLEVVLALEAPPINTHDKSLLQNQRCQNGDMVSDHLSKTTDLDKKPCQISDQDGQTESAIQMQSQKFANCSIRLNFKNNKYFQIVYHNNPQIHKSAGPPPMSPLKQSIGIQPVGAPLPPSHPRMRPNPLNKAPPSRSKSIVPITADEPEHLHKQPQLSPLAFI